MTTFKTVVTTSDSYIKALRPFAYLYNKYWLDGPEVTVVGFKQPDFDLPDNFKFYSMGDQKNYPFDKWSNMLIDFLQDQCHLDYFVLMLEDYWLTHQVRSDYVISLKNYMARCPDILKIDLCADRRFSKGVTDYGTYEDLSLIKSNPKSDYHMSLMTGIWNRDLLLDILVPNESPHDVELRGTNRLRRYGNKISVLGTVVDPWIVRHTLGIRRANPKKVLYNDFCDEDREIVMEMMR